MAYTLMLVEAGYAQGSNARVEVWNDDGPYGHLSVNLPEQLPDSTMFWLKDWSENTFLVAGLLASKRIEIVKEVESVPSGYVFVRAARIVGGAK